MQSVLISSILSLILGFLIIDFNLDIQTLINNNNKESNKFPNLNILRYYNASGVAVQIYEWGRKEINHNYLLQTFDSYIIV